MRSIVKNFLPEEFGETDQGKKDIARFNALLEEEPNAEWEDQVKWFYTDEQISDEAKRTMAKSILCKRVEMHEELEQLLKYGRSSIDFMEIVEKHAEQDYAARHAKCIMLAAGAALLFLFSLLLGRVSSATSSVMTVAQVARMLFYTIGLCLLCSYCWLLPESNMEKCMQRARNVFDMHAGQSVRRAIEFFENQEAWFATFCWTIADWQQNHESNGPEGSEDLENSEKQGTGQKDIQIIN